MNEQNLPVIQGACPVCGQQMQAIRTCDACETPHHIDCWNYNSGCAIYGCRGYAVISAPALSTPKLFVQMLEPLALKVRLACDVAMLMLVMPLVVWQLGPYLLLRIFMNTRIPHDWLSEDICDWYNQKREHIPARFLSALYHWAVLHRKTADFLLELFANTPGKRLLGFGRVPLIEVRQIEKCCQAQAGGAGIGKEIL